MRKLSLTDSINSLPYDHTDPSSIELYAKNLLNKSLRDVLGDNIVQTYKGKGKLGQALEMLYFKYSPNSKSEPDFKEAGMELKTAPIKKGPKGFFSKERLVFNIINYEEVYKESFFTSSFWNKNKLILLMFYLYESGKVEIDYIFKIIRQWKFPDTDLKIIEDDWLKIINKIRQGKAHEISEGDTLYLAACTKGANKKTLRPQPFSTEKAMQRAFSLKSKYLNFIISESLKGQSEAVVKSIHEYKNGETFEEYIIERFEKYIGLTEDELIAKLGIDKSNAKSRYYLISKAILGVKGEIEEFTKADVLMKTIRLEASGKLRESMSFAQIKYKEIINENFEDSYFYTTISKRFFFVIYQKNASNKLFLKKVMFWTMPVNDIKVAKRFWLNTKMKIIKEEFEHFIRISDNMIFHVRPKGVNSSDKMETITGRLEKKNSYWINNSYIKKIIK